MALALLASLLIHALVLCLTFGTEQFGLPGLDFPWRERRLDVPPDLRIVLVPTHTQPSDPAAKPGARTRKA